MKTTLVLPDPLYKRLKRQAVDRSTTLTQLVIDAVTRYFATSAATKTNSAPKKPSLRGILKTKATEADIKELKDMWMKKIP